MSEAESTQLLNVLEHLIIGKIITILYKFDFFKVNGVFNTSQFIIHKYNASFKFPTTTNT